MSKLTRAPSKGDETAWFEPGTRPVRAGLYQVRHAASAHMGREWLWAWWTGHFWCLAATTASAATYYGQQCAASQWAHEWYWRGLDHPPTASDHQTMHRRL